MSFKEMLQGFREEHVSQKNAEFHDAMKLLVDEAISKINIEQMKENLLNKVKTYPHLNNIQETFKFSLNSIFTETYIWINNKLIKNEDKKPLEIWVNNLKIVLTNDINNREELCDYLYSCEPNIQKLRTLFKEAFPEAKISPFIFAHTTSEAFMEINIIYEFEQLQSSEKTTLKPFRKTKGDFVIW